MATESFYEMLMIDTPEKMRQMELAYAIYKERGPWKRNPEIAKKLEEDEEYFRNLKHERENKQAP
ncbi:MAG: hypothetical protein LBS92_03080 [Candidatus Methanoplasma sp.]|jgi:hypothetical protein|nr:hypothetical protein [Candidatus Methanoplasma sp.]